MPRLPSSRNPARSARASPSRCPASRSPTSSCCATDAGVMLGSVGMVSRESSREPRPFTLVHGLLRPALQCLERELASQSSIGDLQRSLVVRDRDLELLLGAAQEEVRRRQLDGRLRQAGAGLRRPPRLRRRRAADSGQEHRRLPHGQRHAAARGRGDPHAHAPPGARLGAAAPADDDVQRPARFRPVREHPVQDPGLPRDARRPARARRARAVQAHARPGLRPAPGAHRRTARAPRRLHPDELVRPDDGPAHAASVREARQRRADARDAAQGQLRHLRRHRPPARAERKPRHARRRPGDRARRRKHPAEPLAAHARGPHFGRPLRHLRARDVGRHDARHRGQPAALVRAARLPARAAAGRGDRELRRGEHRRGAPPAVACAGVRRDRVQGREGPRPQPRRDLLRRRPEHRASLHRPDAHRHGALGPAGPALPARGADDRAAQRRARDAKVRAAAAHERRSGRQRAARQVPVGGGALPARAGDRPLGRAPHDRNAARRTRRGCTRCRRASR